jgi:hypothetical protein
MAANARPRGSSTVLTWVLPHLIAYVALRGYDPSPLTEIRGLRGKDVTDPDTRVADAVAAEVWRLAEAITSDDVLGPAPGGGGTRRGRWTFWNTLFVQALLWDRASSRWPDMAA